ncbi:MAG TPA: DUF4272 domain-containing protein [Dictyoglomaceae bacterium]|nr:DUF4272 domain-containing protein [Dictyoglomaceae bacterium]
MEEEILLNPPDEKTVIYRTLCLAVLLTRAQAEAIYLSSPDKEILHIENGFFSEVKDLVEEENLLPYFTEKEKNLLNKEMGTWDEEEALLSFSYLESLGVLLWSLSFIESLPPYERGFRLNDVLEFTNTIRSIDEFKGRAKLRPYKEITKEREKAELWYFRWKLKKMEEEEYKLGKEQSYKEAIRIIAEKAYKEGAILEIIENDFPVNGEPFPKINKEDYIFLTGVIIERYLTLNWLCGYYRSWEDRKEI